MSIGLTTESKTGRSSMSFRTGSILQRKCACGNHTVAGGECAECEKKEHNLQRKVIEENRSDANNTWLRIPAIQRKLAIGASDDPLEEEADRVANQVISKPANPSIGTSPPRIQRFTGGATTETNVTPPSVDRVLASSGQPLEPSLRQDMEQRFGSDFSRVRVHSGPSAEESARDVNANAYTVGNNVVFAAGQFAPEASQGRRVIAHELTHVIQQSSLNTNEQQGELTDAHSGDTPVQRADEAAEGPVGGHVSKSLTPMRLLIQREESPSGTAEKNLEEKKKAGEVVVEGLKIAAEQAADNNPEVKKAVIDPVKDRIKNQWDRLRTGEKAATISLGAATVGMAGGAMLSNPAGRKQLEGINLAAPFTLIPYMPLSSFKYVLPTGTSPDKRLLKFETGFNADDLINLRTERSGLPKMSLRVNMQWAYDPSTERLAVLGGDASLGFVPGLSLSGGTYKDVLRSPQSFIGPEGQMTQIKKSIPEFGKPEPIPDVRIMLTVDLMKFKPRDLVRQLQRFF